MHYTSDKMLLPSNTAYKNGDTLTIADGTTWEFFEASGWHPAPWVSDVGASSVALVTESGAGAVHKTVLTFTNAPIAILDDADVAQYGGLLAYTFPAGLIMTLGAVVEGSLTAGVTGTIIDNWAGDVALGTATATTGATLTGTEADILPSADVSAGATDKIGVVSSASSATALTETGARWLDGRATPAKTYLNFVIDDDATHTAGSATFTGTVTLTWINLGGAS